MRTIVYVSYCDMLYSEGNVTMVLDPLDQEIASKEADVANSEAKIADCESQIQKLRQALDIMAIEVRMLKRAAILRPAPVRIPIPIPIPAPVPVPQAVATPVTAGSFSGGGAAAPLDPPPPTSQSGRFRDVVDQIRGSR